MRQLDILAISPISVALRVVGARGMVAPHELNKWPHIRDGKEEGRGHRQGELSLGRVAATPIFRQSLSGTTAAPQENDDTK